MGLCIVVIENLHAPGGKAAASGRAAADAVLPAAEPPLHPEVLAGDELVLRLGGPGGVVAAPAPRRAAPASPPAQTSRSPAAPAQHDTYVVQQGDTLSGIAQRELGSARLADELARLNGISDPAALRAGQVLKLR
ncbi:MAG TPA: LysM domain-containing protein [Planctomycetota bacterium]|nr:LysM domain-containing protein [Planctomycetota bacterium]